MDCGEVKLSRPYLWPTAFDQINGLTLTVEVLDRQMIGRVSDSHGTGERIQLLPS